MKALKRSSDLVLVVSLLLLALGIIESSGLLMVLAAALFAVAVGLTLGKRKAARRQAAGHT